VRYHLYSAALVLVASFVLGVSGTRFVLLCLAAIAVLLAELFNTAIETVVDIVAPGQDERARIAKDVAAGAVLIAAFGAAVIGCVVLFPPAYRSFLEGFSIAKHTGDEVAAGAVILVLIVVVIAKAWFGRGTPLRGGMPSGHSALAFSVWVALTFITRNLLASIFCLALASVIARSRVTCGVHSVREVIIGAVLGASITTLLFLIFS
jgi:diacylglycerol kinase (ATP)